MPSTMVSASVSAVALLAMGACAAASKGQEDRRADAQSIAIAPTPSPNPADAAGATAEAAPAVDGGPSLVPWPNAGDCSFPPVSPAEGKTAKQCCHPAPSVTVCLETASLIHNHTVGPFTERTLTVTHVADAQAPRSFPLDRQSHGSMARPDAIIAYLLFRVQQSGLELRVRSGCKSVCATERCGAEEKLVATICTSAGTYGWDGERLVRD